MKKPTEIVELTIPMLPNMEIAATKTAEAVAMYADLEDDKTEEISMALLEACINAIEHSKSKDRNVYIHFIVKPSALIIEIRDKGVGFDIDQVAKPKIKEKIKSEHKRGWGMELMRKLMDEVDVIRENDGTLIRMIKNR